MGCYEGACTLMYLTITLTHPIVWDGGYLLRAQMRAQRGVLRAQMGARMARCASRGGH